MIELIMFRLNAHHLKLSSIAYRLIHVLVTDCKLFIYMRSSLVLIMALPKLCVQQFMGLFIKFICRQIEFHGHVVYHL